MRIALLGLELIFLFITKINFPKFGENGQHFLEEDLSSSNAIFYELQGVV
jgi:hypothetical protein